LSSNNLIDVYEKLLPRSKYKVDNKKIEAAIMDVSKDLKYSQENSK